MHTVDDVKMVTAGPCSNRPSPCENFFGAAHWQQLASQIETDQLWYLPFGEFTESELENQPFLQVNHQVEEVNHQFGSVQKKHVHM